MLLAPALILTLIFKYIPMYGAIIAFKDFSPIKGIMGSDWVGLKHFEKFIASPNFDIILMNTLKLSFLGLIFSFPVPILLALMLNQVRKAGIKKNIQLFLYAPNFISVVVVVGMLFIFLSPTGPINQLATWITGQPIMFMSEPEYFRWIYILSDIWTGAGWASIIYVAALANVDRSFTMRLIWMERISFSVFATLTFQRFVRLWPSSLSLQLAGLCPLDLRRPI